MEKSKSIKSTFFCVALIGLLLSPFSVLAADAPSKDKGQETTRTVSLQLTQKDLNELAEEAASVRQAAAEFKAESLRAEQYQKDFVEGARLAEMLADVIDPNSPKFDLNKAEAISDDLDTVVDRLDAYETAEEMGAISAENTVCAMCGKDNCMCCQAGKCCCRMNDGQCVCAKCAAGSCVPCTTKCATGCAKGTKTSMSDACSKCGKAEKECKGRKRVYL